MNVTIKSITTRNIVEYIAEFARVSRARDGMETDEVQDMKRCKQLWREEHGTCFECIHVDFLVEGVSRALLSQITRYRIMTFNAESQRYCKYDSSTKFIIPEKIQENERALGFFETITSDIILTYNDMLHIKIKPEDARSILPNAMPTRFRVVMNLREFLHYYKQRTTPHAQKEIHNLADMMLEAVKQQISLDSAELLDFITSSFKHTLRDLIARLEIPIRQINEPPEVSLKEIEALISEFKEYV